MKSLSGLNSPLRMRVPADDVGPLRTDTSLHGDAAARMTASLQLESPSAPLEAARTRNDCLPRPTPATAELDDNRLDENSIVVPNFPNNSQQHLSTIN